MAEDKRYIQSTWQIMEQLLEVESIDDALSGSLEIIYNALDSEAGAVWLLDKATDRLTPLFHIGPGGYFRHHGGKLTGHRRIGHQDGKIHHGDGCRDRPTMR